jgi:hypothetical protein
MAKIDCIRKACIEDPNDLYHVESHACFVCGVEFEPSSEMVGEVCEACGWYRCPDCGGCQCSLSEADAAWMDDIRSTYCHNIEKMASVNVGDLPDTENPHVKMGLGMQLRFCRRWAIEQMRQLKDH